MLRFTIFSAIFLIAFGVPLRKFDSDESGPEILAPSDESGPEFLAASDESGPEISAPSDDFYNDYPIDFDAAMELAVQDPEFRQALLAFLSSELQYELQQSDNENQIEDLPSDSNEELEESEDFEGPLKIDSKVIEEHMKNAPKVEEHMKNAPKVEEHMKNAPEVEEHMKNDPKVEEVTPAPSPQPTRMPDEKRGMPEKPFYLGTHEQFKPNF